MKYNIPGGYTYRPYLLNMIENNHTLIAGTTGSGKSVLINNIVKALLVTRSPFDCKLVLLDPKKVELRQYKALPHTLYYTDTTGGALDVLRRTRAIIDNRFRYMQKKGLRTFDGCPIYVIIDEMIDLFLSRESKEIIRALTDIESISRAARVFVIAATQAPNRKILKPEIVLNCTCRVALRCNDSIESRQIIGDGGAVNLPRYGLAIVQNGVDRYNIKIPPLDENELQSIVKAWTRQHKIINHFQHKDTYIH